MKKFIFGLILLLSVGFVFGASASSEASVCCEKTTNGAWCVNGDRSVCDGNFNVAPTSCETTSYCRLGTCYESGEGICMGNTPNRVCLDSGGTWDEREIGEVPQCQLGCCMIADQAAFVSLVRCKRLSGLFGIENDYRSDINNEVECIAEANAQETGACVYEKDFERICDFTTRKECGVSDKIETVEGGNISLSDDKTFYAGFLCSAEELSTSCVRQVKTSCYGGSVYWMDSCGNRENVYSDDLDKSWNHGKVLDASEICSANDGSDASCGNCDYMLGTRCAEIEGFGIRNLGLGKKNVNHYCRKNSCKDGAGRERVNGEAWCARGIDDGKSGVDLSGDGKDAVGSRYYREICIDGEVRVEPCADFRNEICVESGISLGDGGDVFGTSACRVNRWQDCLVQESQSECLNSDRRDCSWFPAVMGMMFGVHDSSGSSGGFSNPSASGGKAFKNPTATGMVSAPISGNSILGGGDSEESEEGGAMTNRPSGVCVPNFPPGLKFWEDSSASQICGQANARCVVVYEKGLMGKEKCVKGCECLEAGWASGANNVCSALGDCGGYLNYVGDATDDGYSWVVDGAAKKLGSGVRSILG